MFFLTNIIVIPAYIDPNTGGMLFQILAVLFGVISGALLLFSGKIKGVYYQLKRKLKRSDTKFVDEPGRTSAEKQS